MAEQIVRVTLFVKAENQNQALEYTRKKLSPWFDKSSGRSQVDGDLLWYGFGTYTREELGDPDFVPNADHE